MKSPFLLKTAACGALVLGVSTVAVEGSVLDLPGQRLTVELARCRVEISTGADANPVLRVLRTDGSEVPVESIGVSVRNNVVKVRDQENQDALTDLVFSFTLQPSQEFQVDGIDLNLTVTGPEIVDAVGRDDGVLDQLADRTDDCAAPRLLILTGGTAHVIGGSCTKVVSTQADVIFERTSRSLEVQATGGSVSVREHQGNIIFNGQSGTIGVIHRHRGVLEAFIDQSRLALKDGDGSVKCQSDRSLFDVRDHRGPLEFSGSSSSVTIHDGNLTGLRLTGADIQGQLLGGQGHIRATVDECGLRIEDWTGRIDLQASRGTTLDIESVDGDFAFSFNDTTGEITGITGHTRGILTDSEIRFSRLKSVEITANTSITSIEDVPQLTQVNIAGGHLDYESSKVVGKPKIILSAEATADIVIPQPCIVRCSGAGARDTGNISVSGCEYRSPNQPWGKRRRQAEKPIHLEVEMQEDTGVFVSGY